eukprot:PhM_4_TR2972/c0_g1_i1/m.3935
MSVSRPFWRAFVPSTVPARIRSVAHRWKAVMFGLSCTAILATQVNYRARLQDESDTTTDRIHRRAYVRLADGRLAQVHPRVYTDLSVCGLWAMVKESFNPLP